MEKGDLHTCKDLLVSGGEVDSSIDVWGSWTWVFHEWDHYGH